MANNDEADKHGGASSGTPPEGDGSAEILLAAVRARAASILSSLDASTSSSTGATPAGGEVASLYHSWVRGPVDVTTDDEDGSSWRPTDRTRFLDSNGFVIVPSFVSSADVGAMKDEMSSLAEKWEPGTKTASFRTDEGQIEAQGSDDYFLDSADRVHFFAEKDALEEGGKLKEDFRKDKMAALNKSGHGLHVLPSPSAFRSYTTSPAVASLVRELGWISPVIPQSMYIFKQPRVGGEVTSHQDSTFLYTTPRQACLGLWLALDDATLENGCLWVRPGSQAEGVRRKFARNPENFGGDASKPQMIFEAFSDEASASSVTWEGSLPQGSDALPYDGLFEAGFVPVECRAGDLVVFPGTTDHLSLPNLSGSPRHTFQLHLVEGPKAGVKWDEGNWLQYPPGRDFLSI